MIAFALAARLVLASVFAVAGVAKLADVEGSRRAMEGFGVSAWFSAAAGRLLPVVELAVAVALVVAGRRGGGRSRRRCCWACSRVRS